MVDIDFEIFLDRVNHDMLMAGVTRRSLDLLPCRVTMDYFSNTNIDHFLVDCHGYIAYNNLELSHSSDGGELSDCFIV